MTPTFFTASIILALISGSVKLPLGVGGVLDLSPLSLGVFGEKQIVGKDGEFENWIAKIKLWGEKVTACYSSLKLSPASVQECWV